MSTKGAATMELIFDIEANHNKDLSSYSEDRLAARLTFLDIVGNGSESASRHYTEYRQILHELRRRWLPWN